MTSRFLKLLQYIQLVEILKLSLLKTHINGWPLRHIISCCRTAIENVPKWIEVHLRHLAKIHPIDIEDTRHFLQKIEQINEKYAPFLPTTLLISWDIENFYPSCDTEKVIEAARKRLEERVSKFENCWQKWFEYDR